MRLVLDLETTSTADLRKTGSHAYAEHPDTRITVLCFAIDDGVVETWLSGPPPLKFLLALSADATIVAHNYLFEFNLYHAKLVPQGWPAIPLSRWSCTMARAMVAGWPASLELAGRALGLTHQKDHAARDLMLRFARPRSHSPLTWWHETDPVRFQALQDYCAQDVETERALDRRVPELSTRERAVFELDHQINQRGLGIDHALVNQLAALTAIAQHDLTRDIIRLTNGQVCSLNQVEKLRHWLKFQGVDTPDLRRGTVQILLTDKAIIGAPRKALQARLDASRSSTAKLAAITGARSLDGRLRGTFQYYGAQRTGRWAGRRLQPQNLFRGSIKDVNGAIAMIEAGAGPGDLDLLFEDSALGVVASCLRSTIIARAGCMLPIADFSQIEARVLAWLAGQRDALDVFARGEDIYAATAKAVGSPSRQLGKVLCLACGFGMGPDRFMQTALSYGIVLDVVEAINAVMAWREVNHHIVTFWWEAHRALMRVMRSGPGASEQVGFCTIIHRPGMILVRLPSGRHLVYRHPRIETNDQGFAEFTYLGSLGGGWTRLRAWPGKLCVAAGTLVLTDQGWLPIQLVSPADRIWDGEAWVRHAGVVSNGIADCVVLDGIAMTPDHQVLTTKGWRYAEFSAGLDRASVELPGGVGAPGGRGAAWGPNTQTRGDLAGALRLWTDQADAPVGFHQGPCKDLRVSEARDDRRETKNAWPVEASGVCSLAIDERSMSSANASSLEELRRSGDHSLPGVAGFIRGILAGYGADLPIGVEHRSGRQRRRLFTGKLCLENVQGSGSKSSTPQAVYDITNAGPRQRFVVAGRAGPLIVHNCENITQAVARDVMVEAMLRLTGVPLIATIHDELIAEVPAAAADATLDRMLGAMRAPPPWALGLPVNAAGFIVRRYQKG